MDIISAKKEKEVSIFFLNFISKLTSFLEVKTMTIKILGELKNLLLAKILHSEQGRVKPEAPNPEDIVIK